MLLKASHFTEEWQFKFNRSLDFAVLTRRPLGTVVRSRKSVQIKNCLMANDYKMITWRFMPPRGITVQLLSTITYKPVTLRCHANLGILDFTAKLQHIRTRRLYLCAVHSFPPSDGKDSAKHDNIQRRKTRKELYLRSHDNSRNRFHDEPNRRSYLCSYFVSYSSF